MNNVYRRKFLSAFRLSFKTTVLAAFVCWLFCLYLSRNKPTSIIYNTYTKDNAYNFSSDVKQTLLENDYLQWVYPELPRSEKAYKSMTQKRIQHGHVRLDFASVEQSLVTRHYPIFLNDDLENNKNIEFQTGRNSLLRDWKYQKAILTKIRKKKLGLEVDVGTPYHHEGLIWMIRNHKGYKKLLIPYKRGNGELSFPELYTQEDFDEKKEDMGTYLFSCTPADTPILMANWKTKRISDVKPGEMVIGFERGNREKKVRSRLKVTQVTGVQERDDYVYDYKMKSGHRMACTKDHKWYTGRKDWSHKLYRPAVKGSPLFEIIHPYKQEGQKMLQDWSYLAGIIDGDGACKYAGIFIHQSKTYNPEVIVSDQHIVDFCRYNIA